MATTVEAHTYLAWIIGRGGSTDADGVARDLIREFGSLGAVVAGSTGRKRRASADEDAIREISRFRGAMLHILQPCAPNRPVIADWGAAHDYLRLDMAFAPIERFRVLYLDTGNRLLSETLLSEGTIDRTNVSIRELLFRALEVGAASLIVAHNHPSGDPAPSQADRDLTERLARACSMLSIDLLDHIIIGSQGAYSFRGAGLLA